MVSLIQGREETSLLTRVLYLLVCLVYALFFVMFVRVIVTDNAVMYDLSNVRCLMFCARPKFRGVIVLGCMYDVGECRQSSVFILIGLFGHLLESENA